MKNIKPAVLAIICTILSLTTQAQYTLTDDDVEVSGGVIMSYSGTETNIIIPNELDGDEITGIGDNVFLDKSLTQVDLSGLTHLETIGGAAFADNLLNAVDLSGLTKLKTIGFSAFFGNEFDFFDLPSPDTQGLWDDGEDSFFQSGENVSVYNGYSFLEYHSLTDDDVVVENGEITSYSGSYPLIIIPNRLDEQVITKIGSNVFEEENLVGVDFSELANLTIIGQRAFHINSLIDIDLSGITNLTTIESRAFAVNSLTSLNLSGLTKLTTIEDFSFYKNSLTNLDLSSLEKLTSIQQSAFEDNLLASVDFTGLTNLTTIGESAFENNSLASVDLSDLTGLTSIGEIAFTANSSLTSFALPLAEGYVYAWEDGDGTMYTNGDVVDNLATSYEAELQNLTAYDITYQADGGSHDNLATYTIEDAVTFIAATKDGYTFEGWFAEEGFTTEITEIDAGSTGGLELFAKFTAIDYAITYHADGGSHDNETMTYTIEDAVTFTAATKDGYTFEGWFAEEGFTTEITEIAAGSTGDMDLFAKFTATGYAIRYHSDGGSHDNPSTYTIEDVVTFTAATKDGYAFEGWFAEEGFTTEITEIAAGSTGDQDLFAKFTATGYAITYHSDGGSHDNETMTYTIEDAVTFTAASKDGHAFEGWFAEESFTTEITEIVEGSTGNMELFAKFTENVLGLDHMGHVELSVYPNPVVSSFSVDGGVDRVTVINADGRVVHTFEGNQARYDVSDLVPGIYIVQLIRSNQHASKHIIIDPSAR